jgi:hypothetical protein
MTRERYFRWMRIWKWFGRTPETPGLGNLYNMLNAVWQEERRTSNEEELAAHSEAWVYEDLDFASDPEYQAYMRERASETEES